MSTSTTFSLAIAPALNSVSAENPGLMSLSVSAIPTSGSYSVHASGAGTNWGGGTVFSAVGVAGVDEMVGVGVVGRFAVSKLHGVGDRVEHRDAIDVLTGFAGGDPGDDLEHQ